MADPVSLEIPMQTLKSSHANNSNCRAHLAPVGEQLGFPMAGSFRSLHIRNNLTAQHQRPTSGSLIKTEIHVSQVTYYVFSTLLNWARGYKRSQALLQGWNLKHAPRTRCCWFLVHTKRQLHSTIQSWAWNATQNSQGCKRSSATNLWVLTSPNDTVVCPQQILEGLATNQIKGKRHGALKCTVWTPLEQS